MQHPEREVPELINKLLTGRSSQRRDVVQRCFAPDAVWERPLFVVRGQAAIYWIYEGWSLLNRRRTTYDATMSVVSEDGSVVVVDGWAHVKPLFWAPLFPTVHMRVISFVHLSMTDDGRSVITKQHDSHVWVGSFVHNIPGFRWLYEVLFRQLNGLYLLAMFQLVYMVLRVLRLDEKADRPFRDAGQEVSAPLMATGNDGREQAARTVGEPFGMTDPAAEVPHLVNLLETGPASERRDAVSTTFAHNSVFEHPFFVVRGRSNIYWVYEGWSAVNRRRVTYDADISVMSKDGSLVAVDGWTHVNPFFWAPFLPVLDVRIISFVHLASNEEGRKVIQKQHDTHVWLGSIARLLFGQLYEHTFRDLFGRFLLVFMRLLYIAVQGLGFGLGTDLPAPRIHKLLQPASMPESVTAEHTSSQRRTDSSGIATAGPAGPQPASTASSQVAQAAAGRSSGADGSDPSVGGPERVLAERTTDDTSGAEGAEAGSIPEGQPFEDDETPFHSPGGTTSSNEWLSPQRRDSNGDLEPATPRPLGGRARGGSPGSGSALEAALEQGLHTSRSVASAAESVQSYHLAELSSSTATPDSATPDVASRATSQVGAEADDTGAQHSGPSELGSPLAAAQQQVRKAPPRLQYAEGRQEQEDVHMADASPKPKRAARITKSYEESRWEAMQRGEADEH